MDLINNKIVQKDIDEILASDLDFKQFFNKSILITGATGMIASYVLLTFYKLNLDYNANIDIYALARNKSKLSDKFPGLLNSPKFHFIQQDVIKPLKLHVDHMDYIIHAASNANPWYMVNKPVEIIEANVLGTLNVLKFAKENKTKQVHFLSSREVYGQQCEIKSSLTEDDFGILKPLDIRAAYPESKKMAENILECCKNEYNIDFTVSRIAHSFGPGMNINNDGRIMSDLIGNVVRKENINLKSDGSALRAFIYLTDTITGIFTEILKGTSGEAYNLSNENEEISIKDLAILLTQLFPDRSKTVNYVKASNTKGYSKIKRIMLNDDKISSLGWKPKISLKEGIVRTVNSFLEEN